MISMSLGILNVIVAFFFLQETKNCSLDTAGKKTDPKPEANGQEMKNLLPKEDQNESNKEETK